MGDQPTTALLLIAFRSKICTLTSMGLPKQEMMSPRPVSETCGWNPTKDPAHALAMQGKGPPRPPEGQPPDGKPSVKTGRKPSGAQAKEKAGIEQNTATSKKNGAAGALKKGANPEAAAPKKDQKAEAATKKAKIDAAKKAAEKGKSAASAAKAVAKASEKSKVAAAAKKPAAKKPASKKPAAKKSASKKPAAKKPEAFKMQKTAPAPAPKGNHLTGHERVTDAVKTLRKAINDEGNKADSMRASLKAKVAENQAKKKQKI